MNRLFDKETLRLMREKFLNTATTDLLNELESFYDKIENGLLIELPCKFGTTVYAIQFRLGKPYIKEKKFSFWEYQAFGKWVFLTKEEAEQRIKELNKGGKQ